MEDDWAEERAGQLPRHRIHRQARRRAELRERAARHHRLRGGGDRAPAGAPCGGCAASPATPGNTLRAVDRHPAAGAGRGAVRRPARRAGGDRPAQRRDPGLRQQAELRPEPVRRRHRRRELAGAQRVARQAAAQPGAARHLPARLDLQAVHGDGGAAHRQAHAAAGDLTIRGYFSFGNHALPRRRGRRPRRRSTCTSRSSSRATPTTTRSPTTWASTRCTTSWRRSASASITGIDLHGEVRGTAAVDRVEAQGLPQEGSAEVVRRRDHLARHRPGLQQLHHAAAGAGARRRWRPAASATSRTWCARSRTTTAARPSCSRSSSRRPLTWKPEHVAVIRNALLRRDPGGHVGARRSPARPTRPAARPARRR